MVEHGFAVEGSSMVLDTCLWISLRLHADTWLRGDTRGCDGGIRTELAAGVRYGQTEGERAQIPDSNDGGFSDPHPGGGTTSLRLDTKEFGSIAFRIDLKAIEILRRELATAEAFIRQPTGKA